MVYDINVGKAKKTSMKSDLSKGNRVRNRFTE